MPDYNTKPLKIKVSISLDDDVIDRMRELAYEDDRTFSQYINHVLRKEINRINLNT